MCRSRNIPTKCELFTIYQIHLRRPLPIMLIYHFHLMYIIISIQFHLQLLEKQ